MDKLELKGRVTLDEFWKHFPKGAEEELLGLVPDGKVGAIQDETACGMVSYWVDECSEGVDRGGYVLWVELHDVNHNGVPVTMEADQHGQALLFEGRRTILI